MANDIYRIRVKGHLDPGWSSWFEGLNITREPDGKTILSGPIEDQAGLFGVLDKVRDLNLTLVSVDRIDAQAAQESCEPVTRPAKSPAGRPGEAA